ncbi:unnamed protein product [Chondrus crispus]|uniref:Integrase catalytic domain-containing protein n=1 Tax=Chondrus crispus TaxID=2769 RepID=S0F3M2_CHOCR|nr:unnamed protein product [Chondrus crispus]CDF77534.1 unnamed protein product [Chondrus crispus]|eukprot:XP_005717318.1 unnamed protein product [Chondrus crispus]
MQSGSVEMGTKARANVAGRGEVEFMLNVNGSPHPCKLSNKCRVTAGPTVVATASQVGDLYILDVMNETFSAHVVTLQTLHERMAHVNVQGTASMIDNNVVSGINRSSSRAQNRLDLVHSDVCGPLEVQSIGGSRYFITFVDDHSNWVVVYTMRNKSEAFAKYKLYENGLSEGHANLHSFAKWNLGP